MRKIMLRVKPKAVADILNGKKTIEVRKNIPGELPCEVYIYCDSHRNYTESLYEVCDEDGGGYDVDSYRPSDPDFILNEKVVAKFTLKEYQMIFCEDREDGETFHPRYDCDRLFEWELKERSCLNTKELRKYLGVKGHAVGYAWYISGLKIFKKPKRLWEYNKKDTYAYEEVTTFARAFGDKYVKKVYGDLCKKFNYGIKNAPSNWCYIDIGG